MCERAGFDPCWCVTHGADFSSEEDACTTGLFLALFGEAFGRFLLGIVQAKPEWQGS